MTILLFISPLAWLACELVMLHRVRAARRRWVRGLSPAGARWLGCRDRSC